MTIGQDSAPPAPSHRSTRHATTLVRIMYLSATAAPMKQVCVSEWPCSGSDELKSPVNRQHLTGDVCAQGIGDTQDPVRDILRVAETARRNAVAFIGEHLVDGVL